MLIAIVVIKYCSDKERKEEEGRGNFSFFLTSTGKMVPSGGNTGLHISLVE